MKRILVFSAFALVSVASVFAQKEEGLFSIQPKVGMNVATTTSEAAEPRIGVAAGVEFEIQFKKAVSVSLGALFSMQGAKGKIYEDAQSIKMDAKVRTNYINIPLMLNVYLAKGFAWKVGVQPSFLIRERYKLAAAQGNKKDNISGKLSDLGFHVQKTELSIPVGFSYEFSNFVIDARYNIGLTHIVEDYNGCNRVFQFTLGYKIKP